MFGSNWPSSGLLIRVNAFSLFRKYFTLEKGREVENLEAYGQSDRLTDDRGKTRISSQLSWTKNKNHV